jgi:hypothetical protein
VLPSPSCDCDWTMDWAIRHILVSDLGRNEFKELRPVETGTAIVIRYTPISEIPGTLDVYRGDSTVAAIMIIVQVEPTRSDKLTPHLTLSSRG